MHSQPDGADRTIRPARQGDDGTTSADTTDSPPSRLLIAARISARIASARALFLSRRRLQPSGAPKNAVTSNIAKIAVMITPPPLRSRARTTGFRGIDHRIPRL